MPQTTITHKYQQGQHVWIASLGVPVEIEIVSILVEIIKDYADIRYGFVDLKHTVQWSLPEIYLHTSKKECEEELEKLKKEMDMYCRR